jgi:hypothetical protein
LTIHRPGRLKYDMTEAWKGLLSTSVLIVVMRSRFYARI